MATQVDIANSALTKMGAPPIMSFDDAIKTARTIKNSFNACYQAVLRAHIWKCATKRAILAPLIAAPAYEYTYAFQKPSDWIRNIDFDDDPEYRMEGQLILSNDSPLYMRYIYDIGAEQVSLLDSLCAEAVACYLAWTISYTITQDAQLRDQMWKDYKKVVAEAKSIDAKDMPWVKMSADELVDSAQGYPTFDRSGR